MTFRRWPSCYWLTGDDDYRRAFEHIWQSIARYDRHNTGGFSSGERAKGNPYDPGAIETCCTIAWIALSIDMLRLTGCSTVADEIELATFNGYLGAQPPSGRWWTYNTPMDGQRRAFYHDYNFQCLAGSPEINCCSANAARGLGMLSEWALMTCADGVTLNYYGPGGFTVATPAGQPLTLTQETDYPLRGQVVVRVVLTRPERFALRLRLPQWSARTRLAINGEAITPLTPGAYAEVDRLWQDGDVIALTLDLSFHFWAGEQECVGLASLYRGPLLLTYDQRYNAMDPDALPILSGRDWSPSRSPGPKSRAPGYCSASGARMAGSLCCAISPPREPRVAITVPGCPFGMCPPAAFPLATHNRIMVQCLIQESSCPSIEPYTWLANPSQTCATISPV